MKTIPQNRILQSKGLGDTIGDIVSSFNLDLNSNYGAIRATRMKSIPLTSGASTIIDLPVAFEKYNAEYYALCTNNVLIGGQRPSVTFAVDETQTDITKQHSDMKIFNGALYVSSSTKVYKKLLDTWSTAIATGLTSGTPHLFETFTSKLYVTNDNYKVYSISTGDVMTTTGATSIDLGLDSNWIITTLKNCSGKLWIGLLNADTGKGRVYSWDGNATIPDARYELESGVVAGTVLDNVLYIIDTQGVLRKYSGSTFAEVARLPKKNINIFDNALYTENTRYVHPNGMQVSDRGTILILLSNELEEIGYEDDIPSGIWEYDKEVGLYHKYSLSVSPTTGTTYNDFGQQRLSEVGALYTGKPSVPSLTENGVLLCGATYFTNATSTAKGIFCDDTFDTTTKYGYLITSFLMSETEDTWQKIYTTYKKLKISTDKIILKYRTTEDEPTETTVTWTDIDRFTSSVDISAYSVGDEIQVLQGVGSGFTAHILSTDGTTYIIDEQLPSACIGLTGKVNVSKWIKAGECKYDEMKQIKALTLSIKNTSPIVQFKICFQFTGKNEVYKFRIINNKDIKE